MKKIIYRSLFSLITLAFLFVVYLTIFGIETSKFNTQIENKLKTINKDFAIQLNRIKLVLDPLKFQLNAKTLGPKFKYKTLRFDLIFLGQSNPHFLFLRRDSDPMSLKLPVTRSHHAVYIFGHLVHHWVRPPRGSAGKVYGKLLRPMRLNLPQGHGDL